MDATPPFFLASVLRVSASVWPSMWTPWHAAPATPGARTRQRPGPRRRPSASVPRGPPCRRRLARSARLLVLELPDLHCVYAFEHLGIACEVPAHFHGFPLDHRRHVRHLCHLATPCQAFPRVPSSCQLAGGIGGDEGRHHVNSGGEKLEDGCTQTTRDWGMGREDGHGNPGMAPGRPCRKSVAGSRGAAGRAGRQPQSRPATRGRPHDLLGVAYPAPTPQVCVLSLEGGCISMNL